MKPPINPKDRAKLPPPAPVTEHCEGCFRFFPRGKLVNTEAAGWMALCDSCRLNGVPQRRDA